MQIKLEYFTNTRHKDELNTHFKDTQQSKNLCLQT